MDTPLDGLIDALEALPDALTNHGIDLLKSPDIDEILVAFNQAQLDAGVRPDGSTISPAYTAYTKKIKSVKGQPTDRVTLRDTGDFYEAEGIKVNGDNFEFIDSDWKTDELLSKYGQVLGISDEDLDTFIEEIKPDFISFARNFLGI